MIALYFARYGSKYTPNSATSSSTFTTMPFIHRLEPPASPPMPELIPYYPFGDLPHHSEEHAPQQYWQQPLGHEHAHDPYQHQQYVRMMPEMHFQPPILHPVFVISCKHCTTLFSNRGMKAVLLLRPGLALYSTDAVPRNCSPLACAMAESDPPEQQLRTCACLTQTLHCHGCGNGVGYFIVAPCVQCTGAADRAANGHRFVFHSTDVVAATRRNPPASKRPRLGIVVGPSPSDNASVLPTVFWHQLGSAGEVSPILGE